MGSKHVINWDFYYLPLAIGLRTAHREGGEEPAPVPDFASVKLMVAPNQWSRVWYLPYLVNLNSNLVCKRYKLPTERHPLSHWPVMTWSRVDFLLTWPLLVLYDTETLRDPTRYSWFSTINQSHLQWRFLGARPPSSSVWQGHAELYADMRVYRKLRRLLNTPWTIFISPAPLTLSARSVSKYRIL
jgi:hypothetical protein